ncbi:hypothetical protein C6H68_05200 [Photorhabdus luminescens]|nr:hypothetical protein C6H68_05200 [Photorhabdus luminescens]
MKQQFPDITLPDINQPITDATLQRTALWQNAQINRQRSTLFITAMELHQAWLYEALGVPRFRDFIIFNLAAFFSTTSFQNHAYTLVANAVYVCARIIHNFRIYGAHVPRSGKRRTWLVNDR